MSDELITTFLAVTALALGVLCVFEVAVRLASA
jgi:hypothetical protein